MTSLGAINGFELSNQGSVDVEVDGHYTHKGNETPSTYEKNTYNQVMSCIQFCLKKS